MQTIKEKARPHSKPSEGRNPWPPVAGRLAQKVDNPAAREKQELESKPSGAPRVLRQFRWPFYQTALPEKGAG